MLHALWPDGFSGRSQIHIIHLKRVLKKMLQGTSESDFLLFQAVAYP